MEPENRTQPAVHLTDDALFALAVPAAGVPEALPAHLLQCVRCARALAEWKDAIRDLGERDEDLLEKRGADEWSAVEDATLAAIRRQGAPGRGRARTLRWALPVAASLLVFALLVTGRRARPALRAEPSEDTAGLSTQDRADDALLRDVDRSPAETTRPAAGERSRRNPERPDPAATEEGRS